MKRTSNPLFDRETLIRTDSTLNWTCPTCKRRVMAHKCRREGGGRTNKMIARDLNSYNRTHPSKRHFMSHSHSLSICLSLRVLHVWLVNIEPRPLPFKSSVCPPSSLFCLVPECDFVKCSFDCLRLFEHQQDVRMSGRL